MIHVTYIILTDISCKISMRRCFPKISPDDDLNQSQIMCHGIEVTNMTDAVYIRERSLFLAGGRVGAKISQPILMGEGGDFFWCIF